MENISAKKEKLIQALEEEAEMIYEKHGTRKEHDLTINYLRTGIYNQKLELDEYELLECAINDLEQLYKDYDIN